MGNVSEQAVPAGTAAALPGASRDGLGILRLDAAADPRTVVYAIDAFVDAWQEGKRPPRGTIAPEDAPYALGSLWGDQLVRQFNWQWVTLIFHDLGNRKALAVVSPDGALAVYPIHFLQDCLENPRIDCTVALSFNLLAAGEVGELKPKEYFNLMNGVCRIVPKR
jgi:hypothetical protein